MSKRLLTDFFRHDHDRIEELFQQFCAARAAGEPAARRSFQEFVQATRRHIEWEDTLMFPLYHSQAGYSDHQIISDIEREHEHLEVLIAGISQKLAQDELGLEPEIAQMDKLMETHHTKEEVIVYSLIDDTLSDTDREQLFARLDGGAAV